METPLWVQCYKVDQLIETVTMPDDVEKRFLWILLCDHRQPYKSPGIQMEAIWGGLPIELREKLTEAVEKEMRG